MTLFETLNLIDDARSKGDANELAALYKKYDAVDLPPVYLVRKARAIQLSDGIEYSLIDAEKCLLQAVRLDPTCLEAYIELGCLYDAVYDDPTKALEQFDRAYRTAFELLIDIDLGRVRTMLQLGRYEDASNILNDPKYLGIADFEAIRNEIASSNGLGL